MKKKHMKRNMKKNGEDSDSKSLLPENKNKRGRRINFQKQNSGQKPRLLICEVAGVWGRKEWAGEGKKERKEREKIEREKSRANHGKDWQCIAKETNQVSLFLLPINKRIHMGQ